MLIQMLEEGFLSLHHAIKRRTKAQVVVLSNQNTWLT